MLISWFGWYRELDERMLWIPKNPLQSPINECCISWAITPQIFIPNTFCRFDSRASMMPFDTYSSTENMLSKIRRAVKLPVLPLSVPQILFERSSISWQQCTFKMRMMRWVCACHSDKTVERWVWGGHVPSHLAQSIWSSNIRIVSWFWSEITVLYS